MRHIAIIAALLASPTYADGIGTIRVDPPVTKPICTTTFLLWTWKGDCNASRVSNSGGGDDHINPPPPETHTPDDPDHPDVGNPGNDKSVGRSGEKESKDMAERGTEGNRGKSN